MSAQITIARHVSLAALPRRRVQCACSPDFGQRPFLENKVLDVTESAYSVSSAFIDTDAAFSSDIAHADEWLGSLPVVSVGTTGGTTFAELECSAPLVPKTDEAAVEEASEGLGAYLMQTPPVRCVFFVVEGLRHQSMMSGLDKSGTFLRIAGHTCIT
jgi:hypothetical protein